MNLLAYFEKHRPKHYVTEWSTRQLCRAVQMAYEQRKNLIVEMHPRGSKSEIVNVYAPSWWLETHVEDNFGLVTSEDGLANKFVSATSKLIANRGIELEYDRANEFKIAGTRSLDATYAGRGVHSNLAGRGFTCLQLDDTLKSGTDAMSDLIRERLWTDVCSAAINRLSPDGIVIALQARLHTQDIIGKLLDTGMRFLRLHLPATNDNGEDAYFEDGYTGERMAIPAYAAMTTRYPREKLDEIKSTVTSYYWSAQYEQEPSLGEMVIFCIDAILRYEHARVERAWLAVDAAQTATQEGSYSVGVALGFDGTRLCVLDVIRGRWRQDQLEQEVINQYGKISNRFGIRPEAVIVERAAAGFGLIDRLSNQLPILPLIPKGSKEERAGAVAYMVNRGQVAVPKDAPWVDAFLAELQGFPLGRYADQVDAFVHALSYVGRPSEFANAPDLEVGTQVRDTVQEYLSSGGGLHDLDEELNALGIGTPDIEIVSPATSRSLRRNRYEF
jgi:predicted phage terminase large subunit-like protein